MKTEDSCTGPVRVTIRPAALAGCGIGDPDFCGGDGTP